MSKCYCCGKEEDYTDQFAVRDSSDRMQATCHSCFKRLGWPNCEDARLAVICREWYYMAGIEDEPTLSSS